MAHVSSGGGASTALVPSGSSGRSEKRSSGGGSGHHHHAHVIGTDKSENRLRRPSTFLCKINFSNCLPEPACQPKLVPLRGDPLRYTSYSVSSLEKAHRHQLHLEVDLGIPLDLLDISPFVPPPPDQRPPLDPEDEALLRDDDIEGFATAAGREDGNKGSRVGGSPAVSAALGKKGPGGTPLARGGVRERPTAEGLNWLVSTQYISPIATAMSSTPKKEALSEKEAKLLALQLELADDQQFASTREGQLRFIESTFQAAKEKPVHPTNPKLEAVEVLPLLPFVDRQGEKFVHVVFDDPPLEDSLQHARLDLATRTRLEAQAIMKQYKSVQATPDGPEGKPFLAYMVPKEDKKPSTGLEDSDEEDEEAVVPYEWVREYHYQVHHPRPEVDRETFLFCFERDAVRFLRLSSKVLLQKLKAMEGGRGIVPGGGFSSQSQELKAEIPIPSKIEVHKRRRLNY